MDEQDVSPTSDSSYFKDSDQLSNMLLDQRSQDTVQRSSYSDAKAIVDKFSAQTDAGAWPNLSRATVAQRLSQLVSVPTPNSPPDMPPDQATNGPRIITQGSLNLCGPASFFEMAIGRDPVAAMQFASDLFNTGSAKLGSLQVSPKQDLLQADFSAMYAKANSKFEQADWMLMGALRNSTDVFWQGSWQGDPSQMVSAMTRPEELAGWMKSAGLWSSVTDSGKWATNPGIVAASNIKISDGTDVALLIHANLIAQSKLFDPANGNAFPDDDPRQTPPTKTDNTFLLSSFPNHWVVLLSEILPDAGGQNVRFTIWTWGKRYHLIAPNQVFLDNYYGAVISQTDTSSTHQGATASNAPSGDGSADPSSGTS